MRRVIFEEKGGPEVLKFDGTTDAEEAITWMAYLNAYNLLTAPRVEPSCWVRCCRIDSGVFL